MKEDLEVLNMSDPLYRIRPRKRRLKGRIILPMEDVF